MTSNVSCKSVLKHYHLDQRPNTKNSDYGLNRRKVPNHIHSDNDSSPEIISLLRPICLYLSTSSGSKNIDYVKPHNYTYQYNQTAK